MSISSIFSRTVDLGTMLSGVMKDNENSPNVLRLKERYKDKISFADELFLQMIKCGYAYLDYEQQYHWKYTIAKNESFPEVEEAKKNLKAFNEKFSINNLPNLQGDEYLVLKEATDYFRPTFREPWVFDKFLEAKFAVVLLAGIGLHKKIDFSNILKIPNSEENKAVSDFLIDHAYKEWKLNGFPVNDKYSIIIYQDALDVRLINYQEASISPK